jgi:pyridoxal phosphate enzyme (YggS family)
MKAIRKTDGFFLCDLCLNFTPFMPINKEAYTELKKELGSAITLVAVSKTKPVEDILALYEMGQRDFGENYVQELVDKAAQLPKDIRWHFIGHLQRNKVKYISSFVHLVHGVDSFKLLEEINKQAEKSGRVINCLLQVYIAKEETKFGLDEAELKLLLATVPKYKQLNKLDNVSILGLMGMASFSDDLEIVRKEFRYLKQLFDQVNTDQQGNQTLEILSMGMSSDYRMAIEEGSTLVRIGSLLFGVRQQPA